MKKKFLVSILMPAYNAEKWIGESIESAVNQSWANTEVIVVDDGSTDGTYELAKSFAASNVKIVKKEHEGASAARNEAYRLCQGDYIQWLDADDILATDKIERQINAASSVFDPYIFLTGRWGTFICNTRRSQFFETALWADLDSLAWLKIKMLSRAWMPPICWLVSRELTEKAGLWNIGLCLDDDGEYISRIIVKCNSIKFVNDSISFHRAAVRTSLSRRTDSRAHESLLNSSLLANKRLLSLEDTPETRALCKKNLDWIAYRLYPEDMGLYRKAQEEARKYNCGELSIQIQGKIVRHLTNFLGVRTSKGLRRFIWDVRLLLRRIADRIHLLLIS